MDDRKTGVVKWFHNEKGFGFIVHEGNDYFVHHKTINMTGYRHLREGQTVTFKAEKRDQGYCAVDVDVDIEAETIE